MVEKSMGRFRRALGGWVEYDRHRGCGLEGLRREARDRAVGGMSGML